LAIFQGQRYCLNDALNGLDLSFRHKDRLAPSLERDPVFACDLGCDYFLCCFLNEAQRLSFVHDVAGKIILEFQYTAYSRDDGIIGRLAFKLRQFLLSDAALFEQQIDILSRIRALLKDLRIDLLQGDARCIDLALNQCFNLEDGRAFINAS